jgi:hypothetical protein
MHGAPTPAAELWVAASQRPELRLQNLVPFRGLQSIRSSRHFGQQMLIPAVAIAMQYASARQSWSMVQVSMQPFAEVTPPAPVKLMHADPAGQSGAQPSSTQ